MVMRLENIELSFDGKEVLKNISLEVGKGEFVCLLGPSGCGKTSTLRICAGLETPDQGRVLIEREEVTNGAYTLPPEKRKTGFLFQDFALFPHLSVFDNVAFGLKGWAKNDIKPRVEEVVNQAKMSKHLHAMPHTLSGGQQQRIALARAMAPKPEIMLLDEPFSGLDSSLRTEMRDITLHVLKENNFAAVMVTHDPEEAMFMSDRIILMREGEIVQNGSPVELYQNPVDHFTASFFGDCNILKGTVRDGVAQTPLGPITLTDNKNAQDVDVLLRPEHVTISSQKIGKYSYPARIELAKYLGRDTLLHIWVEGEDRSVTHLHARAPGFLQPDKNQAVFASMITEHAYLFPTN